jgi:hypothetical protein
MSESQPKFYPKKCAFFTDVEGNLDYFNAYVKMSKIIRFSETGDLDFEENQSDAAFVYGGDSQDKGIGDIRFVKMLLKFKKKYPERVQFIIGNRDGNKIRLCSELNIDLKDEGIMTNKEWQYWIPYEKRVTPQEYLIKNNLNPERDNTWPNRLKWLLKETMGAEGAFERRKKELAIIREKTEDEITDDEVVQSYRDECDPADGKENFMLQYLQQANVAWMYGSTLFVHGGINPKNIGRVPGKIHMIDNARVWVNELNLWAKNELNNFMKNPTNPEMGKGLTDYGSSENGNHGATVTYTNYLVNGNAQHIPTEVQTFMINNTISSVVSGHQPHGDCPMVICTGCSHVITADTSYSEMNSRSPHGYNDNRGQNCVNEVIVHRDGTSEVHGVLQDGQKIEYKLGGVNGDPFVGRQLKSDERWIKAKYKGQDKYLAVKAEGFNMTKFEMTVAELNQELFVEPDIPFRALRMLYNVKRPIFDAKDSKTEENEKDIVVEYWCGCRIRIQRPQKGPLVISQIVPIPIPNEILQGKWKFEKVNESYAWKQTGEWGIYHEEWIDRTLNDLFTKLRIFAL